MIRRPYKQSTYATPSNARQTKSFQDFLHSIQNLDTENYGSWPIAIKVFVILLLLVLIASLAFAFPIKSKIDEIKAAEARQQTLLQVYREKESKARHLDEYKQQVAQMDIEFKELLNQLPKETRVSELVTGINMTGIGSNIRFKDISIEPEIDQELFIEQPIRIEAVGEYHQFGAFLSGLAALPRIITLHDFEVNNPQPSLDTLPELILVLNTKTYRSKALADPISNASQEDTAQGE